MFPDDFLTRPHFRHWQGLARCPVRLIGQTDLRPLVFKYTGRLPQERVENIRWDAGERSLTYQLDGQWYRVALPNVDLNCQP